MVAFFFDPSKVSPRRYTVVRSAQTRYGRHERMAPLGTPDLHRVARALGGEVSGGQVVAPGSGHTAKDRSLSVRLDAKGQDGFIVHSFADNDALKCRDYVREKLGLPAWPPSDHRDAERPTPGPMRVESEHVYRAADGSPYLRIRKFRGESGKSYPQAHWTGSTWANGKPPGPKIPYRLPELLKATQGPVFVGEGEKDADALAAKGFVATTNSEDAGKWTADLNPYFAGKVVYVLADNDKPGADHAQQVAQNLRRRGRSARRQPPRSAPQGGRLGLAGGRQRSRRPDRPLPDYPAFRAEEGSGPRIFSFADLRRKAFDPIRYIVPGIIAEGCTLLVGRPKLGKSWLALEILIAVADGGTCLGGIESKKATALSRPGG